MSSTVPAGRRLGYVLLALLATVWSASAGQLLLQKLQHVVVADDTPIFLMPDATRIPLRTLPSGSSLEVFSAEGSWLRVRFRDAQFGQRVGFIESKHVKQAQRAVDVKPDAPAELSIPTSQKDGGNRPQEQRDRKITAKTKKDSREDRSRGARASER